MKTYVIIRLNGSIYNLQNLEKLRMKSEPADSWRNAIYYFLLNWFDDTDSIRTLTSGSTGEPKEIHLSKESMVNSAQMTNKFFGLTVESNCLLCLPVSYIAGKMMLVRAIVSGFNLITVEPSANPFIYLHTHIDFTAITPYQLFYSAETLHHKSVHKIIVGGGPVTSKLEKLSEDISSEMYETYGMTETCSHIALRRFNGKERSEYFKILEGIKIRLDERGCLAISALHLFNEEIQTNDIVKLKGANSFRWIGRTDSIINTGGIKIYPEQVEKKLEGIIPTSFFISSLPDELLENKLVLIIESESYSFHEEIQFKARLEKVLGKYEIPKHIIYLSSFVYSEGNKVLRKPTMEKVLRMI